MTHSARFPSFVMVMLADQETVSDGEAVAEGFRRFGLGVVIGTRTWGGEIWRSGAKTLSDNGIARAPMSRVHGPEGTWLIEQEGMIPDMVVDNLPDAAQGVRALERLQGL